MQSKELKILANSTQLPTCLRKKILDVLEEDENYAADEIVVLGEEILYQTSIIGICIYLSQPTQKSVYNDFLLQLFQANSLNINAGPLFRWVANMLFSAKSDKLNKIYNLFWDDNILNQNLNN